MKNDRKKPNTDRRANRTILGRSLFLMVLCGVGNLLVGLVLQTIG